MISTYYPIEHSAFPLLFIYPIIISASFVVSILLIRKPHFKHNFVMHCLTSAYIIIMVITSFLFIGLIDAWISGFKQELYLISVQIAYIGVNILNIFVILFSKDIFHPFYHNYKILIAGCIILAILESMPQNAYGIPVQELPDSYKLFRFFTTAIMMLWSISIYIKNIKSANQMAQSFNKGELRFKIIKISHSFIYMSLFFVCLSLETALFVFYSFHAYTIFIYLAWIMLLMFIITSYLGYIMPKWLKKRFVRHQP